MKCSLTYLISCIFLFCTAITAAAAPFGKIDTPPLSERWFGVYVNSQQVGFYQQKIEKIPDGYRLEGSGTVKMKVMNFAKEASSRESYLVSNKLALRSFDVEKSVNGSFSHLSGKVSGSSMHIKCEANGKTTNKILKLKGEVYPASSLNLYAAMRGVSPGTTYNIHFFDPEDIKIKDIKITVLGEHKTAAGVNTLKLRNNLYPFVNNDIWLDGEGNTLKESVREGLVITKAELSKSMESFITAWAFSKQDLVYDFNLVRAEPPITDPHKLIGLSVELTGWNDTLTLLQGGGQQAEKSGISRVIFKTGVLAQNFLSTNLKRPTDANLLPEEQINSQAPEIIAQAKLISAGSMKKEEVAKKLAAWTAIWLKDTANDSESAVASFTSKSGNSQSHSRLYTALARASDIPTNIVFGLVYLEKKGFIYHSWAESFIDGHWVSVDPTYNELPANPTHIKLFEGHLPKDMEPLLAIIGKIRMTILETLYKPK